MGNLCKGKTKYASPAEQTKTDELDEETERGTWGNQCDFILSCLGFTVGLGNLWRFPYLCMRNGGGAFLIPYFTFLLLCGIPLYFLELYIGQFASLSPLCVWNVSPLFKGIGWGILVVCAVCVIYYNLIIAWVLYYLGHSFTAVLPWSHCDNPWNTPHCARSGIDTHNGSHSNMTTVLANVTSNITGYFYHLENVLDAGSQNMDNVTSVQLAGMANKHRTPSEEFWQFQVLELSPGIDQPDGIRWQLLICLLVAWIIIFACLCKGVKSSGKVVYVTATIPYLFLIILLIRGVTLPGAIDGIKFYLIPDFNRLRDFSVWVEACLQIFFSLGPAWGCLITMASYNKFHHNCLRDAICVPLCCGFTSLFAGVVIFSVIGFMAKQSDTSVEDVITSGPGLAFIAYPEAITLLPYAPIWAVAFFVMLLTLGLDTQFAMVETVCSGFVDMCPKHLQNRKTLTAGMVCLAGFLLGLPFVTRGGLYVFQITDWYCAALSVTMIAVLECVVLSHVYGWRRMFYDIEMMIGRHPTYWWTVCWCAITPGIMLVVLVYSCFKLSSPTYGDYRYPTWAIALGWVIAAVSAVPIFLPMLPEVLKQRGSVWQRIKKASRPTDSWGPASPKFRAMYKYGQTEEKQMSVLSTLPA